MSDRDQIIADLDRAHARLARIAELAKQMCEREVLDIYHIWPTADVEDLLSIRNLAEGQPEHKR